MTRLSMVRFAAVAACMLAAGSLVPASAATIPHTPPRQPVTPAVDGSGAPGASALPYLCNKSEVNTRLEKKVCL